MPVKERLQNRYAKQEEQFQNSRQEIQTVNAVTLQSAIFILSFICVGLYVLSFLMPSYYVMRRLYAILLLCMVAVNVVFKPIKSGRGVLCALYFLCSMLLLFSMYLSVIISPEQRATIVLCLLLSIPLLVLDKSWRINCFVVLAYLLHSVLAFCYKLDGIPIDDIINGGIFLILGLYVGESMRKTRLENFELQRQTERLSERDFLTGLYNRRKMYDMMQVGEQNGHLVTGVLLFDIDHFKGFNDHYGHPAGDTCLSQIGHFLTEFGERNDVQLFRFGGEEFIALDFKRDYESLRTLAETLRKGVEELNILYPHYTLGHVSISVGFSGGEGLGVTAPHQLISLADQALYRAKNSGRNCCVGSWALQEMHV